MNGKKGFMNSGLVFLLIVGIFFILFVYDNYYDYFSKKLQFIFQKDTINMVSLNLGRLIAYSKNNILQDAVSDSLARAASEAINSTLNGYKLLIANLDTPNNISLRSDIIPIIDFADGDFASCFYEADYTHYIPSFWTFAYVTNRGDYYSYNSFLNSVATKTINNHNYRFYGIYQPNQVKKVVEKNGGIPLTPDTYTLYIKHQYIGSENHIFTINGKQYYDGAGRVSKEFTIKNANELDFTPSDIVNKVKKRTTGTVTGYIHQNGQDDVFGDQYVEINITPVSYSWTQRDGSYFLSTSSKCGYTASCSCDSTSTHSVSSCDVNSESDHWYVTLNGITYHTVNSYTEYSQYCERAGDCCYPCNCYNGSCDTCCDPDYSLVDRHTTGTYDYYDRVGSNYFYYVSWSSSPCSTCKPKISDKIKYVKFNNFRLKTTVDGRQVTQTLIFDYYTDSYGSSSVTSQTVTFTDFINSTSGSGTVTVHFGSDISITFRVSFKVKSYISGYSLDTYTYNINYRDFYPLNFSSNAYKWGIKFVELKKSGSGNLFIYDVSHIYCLLNTKLSQIAKKLTSDQTKAKLFFSKTVIPNGKLPLNKINSVSTSSVTYTYMNLSRDVSNPNYNYLTGTLNYAPWQNDEEYGGIVGGKILKRQSYELDPSYNHFSTKQLFKRSKAQVKEVCNNFVKNNFQIVNKTIYLYLARVFNDLISNDKNIKDIKIENIDIYSPNVDCEALSSDKGFKINLEICVTYHVYTNDLNKKEKVCGNYNLSYNYKNISFGSNKIYDPRYAKIANKIINIWNNKLYIPLDGSTYFPQYNDVPSDTTGENYKCTEDVLTYRVAGDNVIYSNIILNDTKRWYLNPTYIFNHDLNILNAGYEYDNVVSFCDKIYDNKKYSSDVNYISNTYNYLINAGMRVYGNPIIISQNNFNNWNSQHRYNDV